MTLLKIIAVLLHYPDSAAHAALPEMADAVAADRTLPERERQALTEFIEAQAGQALLDRQEAYVGLFDRGRHVSLHLFEHVHGESRDRGQAMVELLEHYRSRGFTLSVRELPDYLPLFLEFAATQPPAEAIELLDDAMPVFVLLGERLHQRGAAHAVLFDALQKLGRPCAEAEALRRAAADEQPDESFAALDAVWEEEAVSFLGADSPEHSGCGSGRQPTAERPIRWIDAAGDRS